MQATGFEWAQRIAATMDIHPGGEVFGVELPPGLWALAAAIGWELLPFSAIMERGLDPSQLDPCWHVSYNPGAVPH